MLSLFSIELHSNKEVHYYRPLQTLEKSLLCDLDSNKRKENLWISSARGLLLTPNEGQRYHISRKGEGSAGLRLNWICPPASVKGPREQNVCGISTGCRALK